MVENSPTRETQLASAKTSKKDTYCAWTKSISHQDNCQPAFIGVSSTCFCLPKGPAAPRQAAGSLRARRAAPCPWAPAATCAPWRRQSRSPVLGARRRGAVAFWSAAPRLLRFWRKPKRRPHHFWGVCCWLLSVAGGGGGFLLAAMNWNREPLNGGWCT